MKLLKASIENFGKFSRTEFDFNSGLNPFIHENGWGKTTLSNFIKAMFYGMEHTTSKDAEKHDIVKYKPWQGGEFGGSLEFEHNDKKYKILRKFGKSAREDTFQLIDLATNKPSSDYSENIGNEIFNINRETYGRSVHVILSETPAGSTDISAKLTNLIEAGDISSFDEAFKKLNEKARAIVPLKRTSTNRGLLSSKEDAIDKDTEELKNIKSLELQNQDLQNKINIIKKDVKSLEIKQKDISKVLSESAKYESKMRYEQLQDDLKNAETDSKKFKEFFNGTVPDSSYLENIKKLSSEYVTVTSNIAKGSANQGEIDQYNQLKENFGGDIPDEQKIKECVEANAQHSKLMQLNGEKKLSETETADFNKLREKFQDKGISREIIDSNTQKFNSISNLDNQIVVTQQEVLVKENSLNVEKIYRQNNAKQIICFILGSLSIVAGAVLYLMMNNLTGALYSAGAGLVLFVLGFIFKPAKKDFSTQQNEIDELKKQLEALQNKRGSVEKEVAAFINSIIPGAETQFTILNQISVEYSRYETLLSKYNDYMNWVNDNKDSLENYNKVLKEFALRYSKSNSIEDMGTKIQIVSDKVNKFYILQKKINSDNENSNEKNELEKKLTAILADFKTNKSLSFEKQVDEIVEKINNLKNADDSIKIAAQKIEEFENDPKNDVKSFENLKKPEKSADELNGELQIITDQVNSKNKEISAYQQQMDVNYSLIDKKSDIETDIVRCREEAGQLKEEYDILTKTIGFLAEAKEKINASYSDPMKTGFAKYLNLVGGNLKLSIDTDLKVSVESGTQLYGSEFLSEGYKDLVNFCSRMALVDALFKDVKPPVILDDPFVNLDDDKVDNALNIVKEMAKEKQIFYFTCHKSRQI